MKASAIGSIAIMLIMFSTAANALPSEGMTVGRTSGVFDGRIAVDGVLDDWGVTALSPPLSDRPNADWLPSVAGVCYWIEDGVGCGGYVGPGGGGQNYDHEAGFMGINSDYLNLALVTDTEQNASCTTPGDVFFDINADYVPDFAVATTNHHKKFAEDVIAGGLYVPSSGYETNWWTNAGISSSSPARIRPDNFYVDRVTRVVDLGMDFIYHRVNNDHNVIEMVVPWYLPPGTLPDLVTVQFTQTCGNDLLRFTCEPPGGGEEIPEPATVILLGSGPIALGFYRRRRKIA